MDSAAALFRSRHLARLLLSTYPPPLGEKNRPSRRTTSHIDSHMMGYHEYEITELSSPPQDVGEEDPTPIYDPSPDIPTHSRFDPSHDIPTHSRYDPSYTGRQYWMSSNETHHEPASTSYVSYGMSGIPTHDLAFHASQILSITLRL